MKIKISRQQWMEIGKKAGFTKEARRKDSLGKSLALMDKYVLKKKVHGLDDPYFFSNGSIHAPELVMDFKDALQIEGSKLENMAWDWTRDWVAIPIRRPSDTEVFKDFNQRVKEPSVAKKIEKVEKLAIKIPNTQNQNPDSNDFAVDLGGKHKSIPNGIKSRINKEIHALGNYFERPPIDQIFDILGKYNVIGLQEDGTKWSGFVTTQGECGDERTTKFGPMKFELAFKADIDYIVANNYLLMTACTMPSGRLEVIAYIS